MPRPPCPTPFKVCFRCGVKLERKRYNGTLEDNTAFRRRKYCDRKCMAESFVKDAPCYDALSKRAKQFLGSCCEACGDTFMLAAHHIDGNRFNNSPENIQTLCARCHTTHHHHVRRAGLTVPGRMVCLASQEESKSGWTAVKRSETPSCRRSRIKSSDTCNEQEDTCHTTKLR